MKKAVLLLFNDIHISKSDIAGFTTNWNEALSICQERGITKIALGGDLFHSRVSQTLDVLLAVHDALLQAQAAGVLVTIAEGNHDLIDQEALRGYCHIYDQHKNVSVVDDFLTLDDPEWGFVLHMMSYFPEDGSFTDKLNALMRGSMASGKLNYLYIHQGINGALATPAEDELPAHIFDPFDKVFVGHYHNRTKIKGTEIEYIGASRQHNFGENEDMGYTILYCDGSSEFVQNQANIRYRNIDIHIDKVGIALYDMLDELKAEGRYRIKVRVHGSREATANIDKQRLLEAGANKVEVVSEDVEAIEAPEAGVLEKYDNAKIKQSYEEFCSKRSIGNVALGLDYLSKIEAPCGS